MELKFGRKDLVISGISGNQFRWLNLGGRQSKYNAKGQRNFELEIPEEFAADLQQFGWRVKKNGKDANLGKYINTDDLDANLENAIYKMKVIVNYDSKKPPQIYRIVDGKKQKRLMTPNAKNPDFDLSKLDSDMIISGDVTINGYRSLDDGKISAYLAVATFIVEENEVLDKYSDFVLETDDGVVPDYIEES
jgi:hypothetical protein